MSDQQEKISLFQVVISVFAAMFGVQRIIRYQRDFQKGRPAAYIIVGLIMTLVFVLTVWGVVKIVLSFAGV